MIPGVIDLIFLRFVIPFVLFIVTVVRYNGFSFTYLLFLLACPLLARPKCPRSTTKVQVYLILLITLSCIFTLSHPTLHIVLTVAPPYENALRTCEEASIAAQIGVQRLEGMLPYRAMRLVLPDIFILSVAVASLVYFSRRRRVPSALLSSTNALSAVENSIVSHNSDESEHNPKPSVAKNKQLDRTYFNFTRLWNENQKRLWRAWAMDSLRMLITVLLVCFAGITSPSLPSCVYLLSFLSICTYWACRNKVSSTPFASLRIFLLVYSGLHVCLYYLYQFPFFQAFCKDGSFLARLLGLYHIMHTSCKKPGEIIFPSSFRVVDCLAPPITMLLYYVLVLETRRWLDSHFSVSSQPLFRNNIKDSTFQSEVPPNCHDENVDDVNNIPTTRESVSRENLLNPAVTFSDSCSSTNLTTTVSALPTDCGNENITSKDQSYADINNSELHPDQNLAQKCSPSKQCTTMDQKEESLSLGISHIRGEVSTDCTSHVPKSLSHQVTVLHLEPENNSNEQFLSPPVEPHFDALFGLTPPFATYMYGWSGNNVTTERPFLLSLHYSAIKNSYILTLIAMMAWAVVYRSWLSFILLLSACILWIVPKSRAACLYSSPLIVLYAIVLILIQYIYGLNLNSDELPQAVTPDGIQLSELGMQRSDHCVGALALQIGFLICFWLTLRLFVMERAAKRLSAHHQRVVLKSEELQTSSGSTPLPRFQKSLPTILKFRRRSNKEDGNNILLTPFLNMADDFQTHTSYNAAIYGPAASFGTVDNNIYRRFTEFMHSLCVKYWIVVCCLSMLLVSVQQPVVVFRIVYMVMLIYFMLIFQISYTIWRRQMLCFWWVIVVYSMAMLLCIYTFQFNESPSFWQKKLHLSPEILKAFGLETFESAALFERLLTPVVFLVVIILQVHYFHIPFLKASSLNRFQLPQVSRGSVNSRSGIFDDRNSNTSISQSSNMSNFIEDVNSAFQIVVSKLYCWADSLTNHCWRFFEIHWIKLVGLVIIVTCTNEVSATNIVSLIFLVICFPFPYLHGFMTTFVFIWTSVQILCKMTFQLSAVNWNISSSSCVKLHNSTTLDPTDWLGFKKVDNFRQYIMPYGALLVVTVVWHAIAYRQRQFYNNDKITRPGEGIIFPGVTINSMGYDLLNVVKFAFNYGFYKFGLELCHCTTVVTTCARVDAFSVLYLLLMLVFLFSPRRVCARLWPSYMVILAVLIPIQYASCVGLPPGLCLSYPWYTESIEINNLLQWLYLPSDFGAPSAYKLTADFFQFAAVALQFRVFKIEQRPDSERYDGGSNRPILTNELPNEEDRDFVSTKESYLDYMRHLIFYWSYWVSLAVVLVTGVVWITLFCLGYMILSFIYLWMGLNVLLRERPNLINSWNVIIGYNFCVILAKCSLQLMGCVYRSRMANQCWLIQLFGVQCMNPLSWNHFNLPPGHETSCATVSSGLHWDIVCFIFIIFQRKVFTSHSFSHVLLDLQVQSRFASRGAYLINRKLMLAIHEQAMEEQYNLAKVQQKLNLIQQRQEAFGRSNANITEHYIMLRSGDYYLFEGDPEEDDDFVNRQTHITGNDSDHSDKDNSSPPTPALRLRESKHNLRLQKTVISEEIDKQATISNNHTKSQVTLVPNGKNYLRDIWPSIDPNILDVLSNYNDPYSTISFSDELRRVRPTSHSRSALDSDRYYEHPKYFEMHQDRPHSGFVLGHRRMRSHPEFLRQHFSGNEKSSVVSIESDEPKASDSKNLALHPSQTSSDKFAHRFTERRDQNPLTLHHRPYETHRRLFSASGAIFPTKDRPSSPEKSTVVKSTVRSHRRTPKSSLSKPSPPKAHGTSHVEYPIIANKITEGNNSREGNSEKVFTVTDSSEIVESRFTGTHPHNIITKAPQSESQHTNDQKNFSYSYFDDGQEADKDSDEDDDANPPLTANSRLNPIQLLNRAMELGALSTVKQYRRNLYAHSHDGTRQREQTDNITCNISTGSQEGSSADQMTQPSSNRHQISTDSFHIHPPKNTNYSNQTKERRRNGRFPSKFSIKKLSVPDIHSGSRQQPEVHFSDRLCKKYYSPLTEKDVNVSEYCCFDPDNNYFEQTIKNKANLYSVHPLNSSFTGNNDVVDAKVINKERNKCLLNGKSEFNNMMNVNTGRKSHFNPSTSKQTEDTKLNTILLNQSNNHTPSYAIMDKQSAEDNQITVFEKPIKTSHSSSRPFDDNNGSSDINDNDKLRKDSVHQHAEGCWSKFKASCLIAYMFFLSSVDSLIRFLNGLTRQYRRIRRTIDQEKRLVKRRVISYLPSTNEQLRAHLESAALEIISTTPERQLSLFNPQLIERNIQNNEKRSNDTMNPYLIRDNSLDDLDNNTPVTDLQDHEREKAFRQSRSYGFLLLIAVGNLAIVYSELFCYFLLIFNHMHSASLLSLPYPLMVLLWGMLSVPRPTKTFWIFLITYTEIVIVIKYIFQFKFFHFNDAILRPTESAEPLWLPRIIGINKNDDYAVFDLVQLISLFLHRGYLKNNGLWRDDTEFTHDLELIVQENKAAQLSCSKQGTSSRQLASSGVCLNKSKTDLGKDDGLFTGGCNMFVQLYPQTSHYPSTASGGGGGKTWNPLVKLKRFYLKMTDPRYNKKVDVYIYMFLCEFIAFWIMIFGYVSFGPSTGMGDNAFEFLKSNRVPLPFISMLLVQFIFIITDRGLFLQKQVLGKFIFQIIHVVLIHGWLFFILPHITRSPFTSGLAPQLLYLIKCVYFSLSAYQIRSGYPRRILGNFLTKNYNYINLVLFKGYLLVPFLYELRNVMDWMWTSSALSLYHWMELEDVYSKIFILKCWRRSELAYPTPRGQNRDTSKKALTGGLLLLFFFICFWGPMALTSFIGATFDVNPPVLCTFSFSFGGFPPTFEFTSREGNIFTVNSSELNNFIRCHEKDKQTFGFLHNFEWNDLRYVTIDGFSGNIWAITPPSYQALLMKLRSPESDLLLHFHMKCRRSTKEIQSSHTSVEDIFSRKLSPSEKLQLLMVLNSTNFTFPISDSNRNSLYRTSIMNNNNNNSNSMLTRSYQSQIDSVTLNSVLPRYVLLKKDKLRGAYAFLGDPQTYVNVSFHIHQDLISHQTWWELKEKINSSPSSDPCFEVIRHPTLSNNAVEANVLSVLTFNERVSDSLFGKVFNNYGIIGMYAAYIFLASRLLRTAYSNISYVIRLEELPHVDRILNLCHEIYLVRENNLLLLEEQLVAKLFFLYRSSETMIKWTRHPKHIVERFTSKPTSTTTLSQEPPNSAPTTSHPPSSSGTMHPSINQEFRNINNGTNSKPPVHFRRVRNSVDDGNHRLPPPTTTTLLPSSSQYQ